MSFIIELRINAKERICEITDEQGRMLQEAYQSGKLAANISVGGEIVSSSAIQIIAPREIWWERDRVALSQRGHRRCASCFAVNSFGVSCTCKPKNALPSGEKKPEEVKALSRDQMRAGFIRAIKAARAVNPNFPAHEWCKRIMETYLIAPEEIAV